MMVIALVSWWYGAGWAGVARRIGERTEAVLEAFSVSLLLRTFFAPFRQISAGGRVGGPLSVQLQAFGDRVFSRIFGAVVRSIFICFGLIAALCVLVLSVLQLLVWPLVPMLPLAGLGLMVLGWTV
ncbi:MAG TPA: hypothetical protein VKQ34_00010 [Candidatus Saccharimonadales bacterium]|nr:hypothetical protein [Candidatus Saccharimonadales bacterium]